MYEEVKEGRRKRRGMREEWKRRKRRGGGGGGGQNIGMCHGAYDIENKSFSL